MMKQFLLFLFFFVIPTNHFAQNQKPPSETTNDDVLRINTSLVTVPVTVKNRRGGYIANLSQGDFRVYEDGIEQEIAYFETPDKPFTVALLLDISDSAWLKHRDIQNAAVTFVEQLRPNEPVFVVAFDKQIKVLTSVTTELKILF